MAESKSLLIYPGSKQRHVDELLPFVPKRKHTLIVSLFFGGGSFEFYLARHGYKVIACDAFKELVHFWNCVRKNPKRVADLVSTFLPITRESFATIRQKLIESERLGYMEAAMFFIVNRCSFNGNHMSISNRNIASFNRRNGHILELKHFEWPKTLSLVYSDYKTMLYQYPNTFVYADPPYLLKTNNLYGFRGEFHGRFNHIEFANEMKTRRSKWIITYNAHPDIIHLFDTYKIYRLNESYGFIRKKENQMYHGHILITNQ